MLPASSLHHLDLCLDPSGPHVGPADASGGALPGPSPSEAIGLAGFSESSEVGIVSGVGDFSSLGGGTGLAAPLWTSGFSSGSSLGSNWG